LKWAFPTRAGWGTSSPAVGEDGAIYVGSPDDSEEAGSREGKLYAVNPDGTLKWELRVEGGMSSSPAVGEDGAIYVGSGVTTGDGKLYAVSPDGRLKWAFPTEGRGTSSPAVGEDGTIYAGSENGKLYAVKPDGTLKWEIQTEKEVFSSPAARPNGTVYAGSRDGRLYAVGPDGELEWTFPTGGKVESSPAIGVDGTIYAGSWDGKLYAVSPNGRLKWAFPTEGAVSSSPAIGEDGTVYAGSEDGNLYAVSPDGELEWKLAAGGWVYSSPAVGDDGTIYAGSEDGNLYAVSPDGELEWKLATEGWVSSSPAVGEDGTVYAGSTDGHLYAVHSASAGLADSPWPMFGHDAKHTRKAGEKTDATVVVPDGDSEAYDFDRAGDEDWFKFHALKGQVYTVTVTNVGERADAVVEVQDETGAVLSLERSVSDHSARRDSRASEATVQFAPERDGVYLIRVRSADPEVYGEGTEYSLAVTTRLAPSKTSTLVGTVRDAFTGRGLERVRLRTDLECSALTTPAGEYILPHPPGTLVLEAEADGYDSLARTVSLPEGKKLVLDLSMTPEQCTAGGSPEASVTTRECPILGLRLSRKCSALGSGRFFVGVGVPNVFPDYMWLRPGDDMTPLPGGGYVRLAKTPEGFVEGAGDFFYQEIEEDEEDIVFVLGIGGLEGLILELGTWLLPSGKELSEADLQPVQSLLVEIR